ncbi:GNAT family N-acetyltransferase [Metabacillus arenae]|uniref:GNAT family N-acetyltransferase n=1 Tax=Metabacillus arenae TaxID=2771434 RepID=A0A926N925_9BACI|nr:GNAT family N-acetyltransferase [Metabacillus arenae]MBD1379747.1 GNAT family N-acetyltransferase [Metabacillus arenae]
MREIRKFKEEEIEKSLELSQFAFQYSIPANEIEKQKEQIKNHEVIGVFDENQLCSKLHIIPFQVFFKDKVCAMGGIAGVASWPEFRRQGSVKDLLKSSLAAMREKGQLLSYLHPFKISFYRKFGWEVSASLKKYEMKKEDLVAFPDSNGFIRRRSKDEAVPLLNEIYEDFAKQYVGMLKRDSSWWANSVLSEGCHAAFYFDEEKSPKGYLLYKVSERKMNVKEFVCFDGKARSELWNFICQHDSMIQSLTMVVTEDDQLPFLLHNPEIKQEIYPFGMVRVVDVAGFLEIGFLPAVDEEIVLTITDSYAEWNDATFIYKNGKVEKVLNYVPLSKEREQKQLIMDINTFSVLAVGYRSPAFLYEIGRIHGRKEHVEALKQLIDPANTSLLDFF